MRRAAASIGLNLAEGHGRLTRAEQARFALIARGSALECLGILDLIEGLVLRFAVAFHRLAADLAPYGSGLGDQLRRAAASIPLNLAEGHGRLTRAEQARSTLVARGSALECLAVLDILEGGDVDGAVLQDARRLLRRVVQTTTGLWRKQAG